MNAKERKALRKKYVEVEAQLVRTINNSDYEIDIAGDIVDELQGKSIARVQEKLLTNNIAKLKSVRIAIEKIDLGEYGYCDECGESIGIRRLEILPGCTICVLCAEQAERLR